MNYKKILPIIGIIIFVYLVYKVGISNIIDSFKTIKWGYLLIAIFLASLVIILLAFKWGVILKKQDIHLGFWYLQKTYLIGLFYGFITPARAGSLIRATCVREKTNKPIAECTSSIILERILDLFVIFILSVTGAALLTEFIKGILSKIALAFIIFVVFVLFFIGKKRSRFVLRLVYKFLVPEKFKKIARSSFHSFYKSLPSIRKLAYPLLLTFIVWILNYTQEYTLAKAFSINIPYYYFITIVPIATIISLIPITIGGLGTREAALITLFSVFGVPAKSVLSMSVVALLILSGIPTLLGFIYSLKK